jgi:RNA polymerase sigma-70 factor (ECF subfamily)
VSSARTGGIETSTDGLGERARAGDADAFGDLVGQHRPAALRVATVVLGTAEGADDVVQQATERAWRALASYRAIDRLRHGSSESWRTARNDRRSAGGGLLAVRATETGTSVTSPEDAVIADEDRQRVVRAMNRLASGDRLVIALRHFEGMTEIDMAETLHCRIGTVKSRLSRAMARLRTELEATEVPDA